MHMGLHRHGEWALVETLNHSDCMALKLSRKCPPSPQLHPASCSADCCCPGQCRSQRARGIYEAPGGGSGSWADGQAREWKRDKFEK